MFEKLKSIFIPSDLNEINILKSQLMEMKEKVESKSYLMNPFDFLNAVEYKDKPFSLSYDILRRMTERVVVIGAVIQTRLNQLSLFCDPIRFQEQGNAGFRLRLRDPKVPPTKAQRKEMDKIEEWLIRCGDVLSGDDFVDFVKKIARDRLTYDQMNFEKVRTRKGDLAGFVAVDASTIRLATSRLSDKYKQNETKRWFTEDDTVYVQIVDGRVLVDYTPKELAFCINNPRTFLRTFGYGFSELEQLVNIVTSQIWAEEYNRRFFSQGSVIKGMLNIKGNNMKKETLESFKRQWQATISGVSNSWKTPVFNVEDLQWINLHATNREMEFGKWMEYLVNLMCSLYQIDPVEINFANRGGIGQGNNSALFEKGNEQKVKYSKDKGLKPLLRYIQRMINKHLIFEINPDYYFEFAGYDVDSDKDVAELESKRATYLMTINELRKEHDMQPIEAGDIVLSPYYVQEKQMASAMGGGQAPESAGEDNFMDEENVTDETGGNETNSSATSNSETPESEDNAFNDLELSDTQKNKDLIKSVKVPIRKVKQKKAGQNKTYAIEIEF